MPETIKNASQIRDVTQAMSAAKRILGVTHANPDGDAIGSLVSLGLIAASLGIDVRLYCETPLPYHLDWLNSPTPIISSLETLAPWRPDQVVFLDCAESSRAGQDITAFIAACREESPVQTLCVDHHTANPHFADTNWVDSSMSATGIMVALLAKELGIPLSGDLGEAICLAIVADTGSFSYANTSALALELTAEIVRNGLSIGAFTTKYENHWTLDRMQLWGVLMQEVQVLCNGKAVVSVVTEAMLERYNAPHAYLEDYASWLRRLANSKVVMLARPSRTGCKISLRSMGDVDVQQIAAQFGGGGHRGAAGIDMAEEPPAAAEKVLEAVCRALGEPYQKVDIPL